VLAALLLLAGAVLGQDSTVDEWVDQGALEMTVKIGQIIPVGRLGLVSAVSTSGGGPSSLLSVDLHLLAPARILSDDDIDVEAYVLHFNFYPTSFFPLVVGFFFFF